MRIVIRADAGNVEELGTGHLVRAIELCNELRRHPRFHSAEIRFATRGEGPFGLGPKLISGAGFDVIPDKGLIPNSIEEAGSLIESEPELVILDRLETDASLITRLKESGIIVVTFDDLGSGRKHADLAVQALLQNVESEANVCNGFSYLVLPQFPHQYHEVREEVRKIFVCFGGFDRREFTDLILDLIPCWPAHLEFELIVGNDDSKRLAEYRERAAKLSKRRAGRISIHVRPSNFSKLLVTSDLAVVSGGMTAFECVRAGVPAIGLPQYQHQIENLRRLNGFGAMGMVSEDMESEHNEVVAAVLTLVDDFRARKRISINGKKLLDGRGGERVVERINKLFAERKSEKARKQQ